MTLPPVTYNGETNRLEISFTGTSKEWQEAISQATGPNGVIAGRIQELESENFSLAKIIESHERRIRDLEIGRSPRRG